MLVPDTIKEQFAIFRTNPNLVYLDNAASTQTFDRVIEAMNDYYTGYRANIHRGLYELSARATRAYDEARRQVASFINAESGEVIFTSGTTAGLNILAYSLCPSLGSDDNVVLTEMEHHANLIPWQVMAKRYGFSLRFIPFGQETYRLDMDKAREYIDEHTRIVSFTAASNVLGVLNPYAELCALAKKAGAISIVDAAQLAAHRSIDVKTIDCDFLVFSGHKVYGPTGIGVLYGKRERLEVLEPHFYGGDMVHEVSLTDASWTDVPERFEGGTPNIAGAIGLARAFDSLGRIDLAALKQHETDLTGYALGALSALKGVQLIGPDNVDHRIGVISFTVPGVHPHDIAEIANTYEVAIRAGHHCAAPLMKLLRVAATARLSFGLYNTKADVDRLITAIQQAITVFR